MAVLQAMTDGYMFRPVASIFSGASAYGSPSTGPWLVLVLRVLFWIYVAVTYLVAVAQYYYLFTAKPGALTIQSMTPSWILPIFPAFVLPHSSLLYIRCALALT